MPTFINRKRGARDDVKDISNFISEKQKGWKVLKRELKNIEAMFDFYEFAVEDPAHYMALRKYGKLEAIAFHFLYDSKAACLGYVSEFRALVRKKLGCCPYCGLPGNITLDHYLPRNINAFPEYSVLSKNLVPACSDCQDKKKDFFNYRRRMILNRGGRFKPRDKIFDSLSSGVKDLRRKSRSSRRFIHPYLDSFIINPVLDVIPSERPGFFRVEAKKSLQGWKREILNFHLRKLKVAERSEGDICRYRNAVIKDLSIILDNFERSKVYKELPRLLGSAELRAAPSHNAIEPSYIRSLMNNSSAMDDLIAASEGRSLGNILIATPVDI